MTAVLLFCTAEEAKPFMYTVMNAFEDFGGRGLFYVVESRVCPSNSEEFKRKLSEGEAFGTEFIGASAEDCQRWTMENQRQCNFIEQGFIAIADARSATDETLLIQSYYGEQLDLDFGEYGILPRQGNTWYDFRVNYRSAEKVFACLNFVSPEAAYPIYFGRKEELTDERGVFDAERADRIFYEDQ